MHTSLEAAVNPLEELKLRLALAEQALADSQRREKEAYAQLRIRSQYEEKLRWSEMLLAEAQQLTHIGSWNWDLATGTLDWSDEQYRLFGLQRGSEPLTFERVMECIHPIDQAWVHNTVAHAHGVELLDEVTLRAIQPDGSERLLLSRGRVVHDASGNPIRMFGTCQDITDQKRTEAALAESRNWSQAIFKNSTEAILLINDEARYVDANPAACELLGYSRQELLRLNVRDVTPAPERCNVEAMLREFVDAGSMNGEYTILRKDGDTRDVEFRSVANILPGLHLGVHRDITERKKVQAERERLYQEVAANEGLLGRLSRRLIDAQETERRNLARELHDEVGQVLTTVHLNLEALRSRVDPRFWPRIDEGLQVVDRAIDQIRNLSMDLRPASLDILGLEAALRAYLGRQAKRAGIVLHLKSSLDGQRFSSTLETVCFRVAQEAFTNVVRHARAKECSVDLALAGEELILRIRDDGVGFDFATARRRGVQGQGFGLFSMFERVHLFGGRIRIVSTPETGTAIEVELPLALAAR